MQGMPAKKQDLGEDLRWDDVRIFLASHRYKSLGAAAGKLALDTSTVSRRLTAFETSLGQRLFERSRDGLHPTHAAEAVLAAAEAMEAAIGRLGRDASNVETEPAGIVRLSVAPGMADVFVAPALARLHAEHPGIDIELDASMRTLDLTRHEADLALRSVRPRGADLVMAKLGTARWVPATSKARAKSLGKLTRWDDAPWIGWDRDLASFGPARWLVENVPRARIILRTSHFGAQLSAAATGLGLALVPIPYVDRRGLEEVRLAPKLASTASALPVDTLWIVGHRALRDVPRVAAVWSFLVREFTLGA